RPAENSMLPATGRQGRSTGGWKTTPTSGTGPRTTVPRTRILPPLTGVSPATSLSNVDLPQPLGPTRVTNSFSAMSSVTSSSAGTRSPRRVRDVLSTPPSRVKGQPGGPPPPHFFAGRGTVGEISPEVPLPFRPTEHRDLVLA